MSKIKDLEEKVLLSIHEDWTQIERFVRSLQRSGSELDSRISTRQNSNYQGELSQKMQYFVRTSPVHLLSAGIYQNSTKCQITQPFLKHTVSPNSIFGRPSLKSTIPVTLFIDLKKYKTIVVFTQTEVFCHFSLTYSPVHQKTYDYVFN